MSKRLLTWGVSMVAMLGMGLLSSGFVVADPPRDEVRPGYAPPAVRNDVRDTREAARDAAQDNRIERRRERRSHGDLGIDLGRVVDRGLAIANLVTNGVLYRAGLRSGDYIVSVNGHRLEAQGDFDRWVYAENPDQPVTIVVWRDGREQTLTLNANEFYANDPYNNDLAYFGVTIDERYPDRIVILSVLPGTPAFNAGLRAGDEIKTWHGNPVRSARELAEIVHRAQPGRVDFEFMRDSKPMRVEANFSRREENNNATGVKEKETPENPNSRVPAAPGSNVPGAPGGSTVPGSHPQPVPGTPRVPPSVVPSHPENPGPAPGTRPVPGTGTAPEGHDR